MEEAQKFFMGSFYNGGCVPKEFFPEKRVLVSDQKAAAAAAAAAAAGEQHFMVEDLLDFPTDDDAIITDAFLGNNTSNNYVAKSGNINMVADNSSNFTSGNDSCNSSGSGNVGYQSFADSHFSNELCVPYDDLAELEWLSNFVEDSFSTKQNLQTNFHILTGSKPLTPESSSSETHPEPMMTRNPTNNPIFQREIPLPGKARSKRSRAAPCDWSTRLLHVSASTSKGHSKKQEKPNPNPNPNPDTDGQVRKCLHCGAEKTPQWRTGPMGPKTLCNACGVRYKSGRLVSEYRPAASPTFVASKHSNSHRKVLELRRQKELHRAQQEHFLNQNSIFAVSTGGDDFLIHHHSVPHFRHMI